MAKPVATPKRQCREMSFSPEMITQTENLRDMLREILDEKLLEHIKPLKDNFGSMEHEICQLKLKHTEDVAQLKEENKKLQDHVNRLESFQRKNNIKFLSVPEEKDENLEQKVLDICNQFLEGPHRLDWRSFERIHRLGGVRKGMSRAVIARLANFKDKLNILRIKKDIYVKYKIVIAEDFPLEIAEARRKLYPVKEAVKGSLEQDGKDPSGIYLKDDKLVVKSETYTIRDLDSQQCNLDLNNLFTPTRNDITAFYSKYSVLSNHHPCRFTVNGESYSSMEQFLFIQIAELFGDQQLIHKISSEHDPVIIKRLAKKVKNFDKSVWKRDIGKILHDGLLKKFMQNPELGAFLISTGDTIIVEASKYAKEYGIGLSLGDKKLWDRKQWKGNNLMGQALMKVRSELKSLD